MSRPWTPRIYVNPGLAAAPQVCHIAGLVVRTPAQVVDALVAFWLEAQARGDDGGRLERKSLAWVDMIGGIPGLAVAMVAVEWLRAEDGDLIVPGFADRISKEATGRIERARGQAVKRGSCSSHAANLERREVTCIHVNARDPKSHAKAVQPALPGIKAKPEPKPKAAKVKDPNFWKFWKAYPKQWNQPAAVVEWDNLSPDDGLVETMLKAIEAWKQSPQWAKRAPDGTDFIPAPANWLAGRRWQDPIDPAGAAGGVHSGARIRSGSGEYGRKRSYQSPQAAEVPPKPQPTLFDPQAEEPGGRPGEPGPGGG